MTTGTILAFIFTAITAPVAIVGGIWLEARMPAPPPQHTRFARSLASAPPVGRQAQGASSDMRHCGTADV